MTDSAEKMELPPLHWIYGYFDGDLDWCRSCAENKIKELKVQQPNTEFILDGGWLTECDAPPQCENCGCDLDYIPTDYCLKEYPESKEMA